MVEPPWEVVQNKTGPTPHPYFAQDQQKLSKVLKITQGPPSGPHQAHSS